MILSPAQRIERARRNRERLEDTMGCICMVIIIAVVLLAPLILE